MWKMRREVVVCKRVYNVHPTTFSCFIKLMQVHGNHSHLAFSINYHCTSTCQWLSLCVCRSALKKMFSTSWNERHGATDARTRFYNESQAQAPFFVCIENRFYLVEHFQGYNRKSTKTKLFKLMNLLRDIIISRHTHHFAILIASQFQ